MCFTDAIDRSLLMFLSEFSYSFINAARQAHLEAEYASFESNILKLPKKDLKLFLDCLCV